MHGVDHNGDDFPALDTVAGGFEAGVDAVLAHHSASRGGQDHLVPAPIFVQKRYNILNIYSIYLHIYSIYTGYTDIYICYNSLFQDVIFIIATPLTLWVCEILILLFNGSRFAGSPLASRRS